MKFSAFVSRVPAHYDSITSDQFRPRKMQNPTISENESEPSLQSSNGNGGLLPTTSPAPIGSVQSASYEIRVDTSTIGSFTSSTGGSWATISLPDLTTFRLDMNYDIRLGEGDKIIRIDTKTFKVTLPDEIDLDDASAIFWEYVAGGPKYAARIKELERDLQETKDELQLHKDFIDDLTQCKIN